MTTPDTPIKFYSMHLSGNAHRVELLLRALDLPYEKIEVNLRAREQKTPDFLAMNPFGQVPVIDDNGTVIWDSIAIMTYLALTYDNGTWLPRDPKTFAEVIAWLGKVAGPIAYGPATARRIVLFNTPHDPEPARQTAADFLTVTDGLLSGRDWLAGDHATLADLACYSYIAHAPEGGVDLTPFAHITAWLARIEALPCFTAMKRSNVGLWAESA